MILYLPRPSLTEFSKKASFLPSTASREFNSRQLVSAFSRLTPDDGIVRNGSIKQVSLFRTIEFRRELPCNILTWAMTFGRLSSRYPSPYLSTNNEQILLNSVE